MKIFFDPKYNIGYIQLLEGDYQLETISLRNDVNLDLTEDGQVYGIELLNANSQLMAGGLSKIILQNTATGTIEEVKLPQ